MSALSSSALLVVLMALVWIGAAVAATIVGQRRAAGAAAARREVLRMEALLAAAPCIALLAYRGGEIEADARAAAWLGLAEPPSDLAALTAAGFDETQIAALAGEIEATLASGRPLAMVLPLSDNERQLRLSGAPHAALGDRRDAVLIWISDVTAGRHAVERLTGERDRLARALDGMSALVEAAPFPIWQRGPDLSLVLVNDAYVRAVEGQGADDVIRRGLELMETSAGRAPAATARHSRDSGTLSIRILPAIVEGERRMMRVTDVPIADLGIAGFATDVQELQDARADLVRFIHAQHAMFDRISAAVAQFAVDRTLVFANRHFLHLFGMDHDALADRPEFDRVLERMRDAQRAPETRDFRAWRMERRGWFSSTEPIEENWLLPGGTHLRVVPQPLPDGGLLVIFEDRTEHLQLASARDTLLRVRAATFDSLFEAIGVFAADGRLHLWNNPFREMWGLAAADLVEHPRVDALAQTIAPRLLDPGHAGMIRELVRAATVDRQQRTGRLALADGRHFQFAAVPLPDGNALFTLLDITASQGIEEMLRARNEALEEANQLKSGFVARMSYELRVPLTTIAGFAEMLAAGYAGALPPQARDYVDAILAAIARLGALIGDALDLSQSEVGTLPIAAERLPVDELVRGAGRAAANAARDAGVRLALDIAVESGTVSGDPRRLRRCLDHLLRNAITHSAAGSRVLVTVRTDEARVEIGIADTGVGIPDREVSRLLDDVPRSFMPGASDGDDAPAGVRGVGLPLARRVVEAHGGTLHLVSKVGQGTTVVIHLPLSVEHG